MPVLKASFNPRSLPPRWNWPSRHLGSPRTRSLTWSSSCRPSWRPCLTSALSSRLVSLPLKFGLLPLYLPIRPLLYPPYCLLRSRPFCLLLSLLFCRLLFLPLCRLLFLPLCPPQTSCPFLTLPFYPILPLPSCPRLFLLFCPPLSSQRNSLWYIRRVFSKPQSHLSQHSQGNKENWQDQYSSMLFQLCWMYILLRLLNQKLLADFPFWRYCSCVTCRRN